jgi:hypothetical protein
MVEKIIVMMLCLVTIVVSDTSKWIHSGLRERLIYVIVLLIFLYFGVIYVMDTNWPNLQHLLDLLLTGPAKQIVNWFKSP